jgi:hypothetical protein
MALVGEACLLGDLAEALFSTAWHSSIRSTGRAPNAHRQPTATAATPRPRAAGAVQ